MNHKKQLETLVSDYLKQSLNKIENIFGYQIREELDCMFNPDLDFNGTKNGEALGKYLELTRDDVDFWSFCKYADVHVDSILALNARKIDCHSFIYELIDRLKHHRNSGIAIQKFMVVDRLTKIMGHEVAQAIGKYWIKNRENYRDVRIIKRWLQLEYGCLSNINHITAVMTRKQHPELLQ